MTRLPVQAVGTPPMLAAIALGQLSNVMGCLSTYGIGSAPPYYGAGYVPQSKWYQLGFLLSIFYIAVWLFAGGAWWKVRLFSLALQQVSAGCFAACIAWRL